MDTVGNLEEDQPSSVGDSEEELTSVGDSEEEETDPRVQQKVGEIVMAVCLALQIKWVLNSFITVHKHFHMVVGCQCYQNIPGA